MSLGEKIADSLPDSAIEYVNAHPRVVYLITVPLLVWAAWNLEKAYRLQAHAELFVRQRLSDAARAASEALGG
jgi:hypothetical protein